MVANNEMPRIHLDELDREESFAQAVRVAMRCVGATEWKFFRVKLDRRPDARWRLTGNAAFRVGGLWYVCRFLLRNDGARFFSVCDKKVMTNASVDDAIAAWRIHHLRDGIDAFKFCLNRYPDERVENLLGIETGVAELNAILAGIRERGGDLYNVLTGV